MYGVALEGGGARGAYHIGALKALVENGYEISGIVGTSIGSFNAAVFAQGDLDKLYKFWTSSTSADIINMNKDDIVKIVNKKIDRSLVKNITEYLKVAFSNKGMDFSNYKKMLDNFIDEDKLRKSNVDFGLVTVSVTDKKPLELYKDDIDNGMISSYVMASSYLPVFRTEKIQDKVFIDGGFYNNCPIDMLIKKGYKDIIEIRTKAVGVYRRVKRRKDVNIISIEPSEDLGSILFTDVELANRNVKMGYYDTLRVIKRLKGKTYYINSNDKKSAFNTLLKLSEDQIYSIAEDSIKNVNSIEAKKLLFSYILPEIERKFKLQKTLSYDALLIGIVEYLLKEEELVDRYNIYDLKHLILELKKNSTKLIEKEKSSVIKNSAKLMALKLIREINIEKL